MTNEPLKPEAAQGLLQNAPQSKVDRYWDAWLRWLDVTVRWIAGNYQYVARAGMEGAPPNGVYGAGWNPIINYSKVTVPDEKITTDLVAGTMVFPYEGIIDVRIKTELLIDTQVTSRQTFIRGFNVTDAAIVGPSVAIGIYANQDFAVDQSVAFFPITSAEVGKAIRLEIGGGSAVTVSGGMIIWEVRYDSAFPGSIPETG